VAVSCEYGDEPSDSGATHLVSSSRTPSLRVTDHVLQSYEILGNTAVLDI
jgi:hypothetical protein